MFLDEVWPNIDNLQKETITSLAVAGAAVGSLIGGPMADKIGRRTTLIVGDILNVIGALFMSLTPNVSLLMFGRFVVGVAIGFSSMAAPVFLSESTPIEIRGVAVTIFQFCIVGGQMLAIIICLALGNFWRAMLGMVIVFSVLQLVMLLFLSETPSHLLNKDRTVEAKQVINRIYNSANADYRL